MENSLPTRRIFLWTLGAYCLLFGPLLIVGRLMCDDHMRAMEGGAGWGTAARPLSDILYYLLRLGGRGVSTYGLDQLLALVLLAAAATVIAVMFKATSPAFAALAAIPFAAHPYFLENISWAFDVPLVSAGVLTATLAAASAVTLSSGRSLIVGALLLTASLMLYQATTTIFFTIVVFFMVKACFEANDQGLARNIVLRSAGVALIAVSLYQLYRIFLFQMPPGSHGAYVKHSSELPSLSAFAPTLWANIKTYWRILASDWGSSVPSWAFVLTQVVGIGTLFASRKSIRVGLWSVVSVIALLLIIVGQLGLLLILLHPSWLPRVFIAFGLLPALAAMQTMTPVQSLLQRGARIAACAVALPILLLDYSCLLVAHATAAASRAQLDFETQQTARLVADIAPLRETNHIVGVAFVGAAPISPVVRNTARAFPVVGRVIGKPFEHWIWGPLLLRKAGLPLRAEFGTGFGDIILRDKLSPLKKGIGYELFLSKDILIVRFSPDRNL